MKTFLIHFGLWLLLTGFTIALWTLGKEKDGSLKDGYAFWTVVWAFITLRFIAQHVSISKILFNPLSKVWNATAVPATRNIPKNFLFGGILVATLACMLISALFTSSDESTRGERVQSWAGVIFILALAAASSRNKRAINIQTVAVGILLQFLFALLVLKWETGTNIFDWFSKFIRTFLEYAYDGLSFLVWGLEKNTFAVNVLPAIIFFCSFIQVVYYWGGMQYLVQTLGRVMMTLMDTSGAESVVAAASPFVGQVENALLVLPFIEYMTKSELHAVMCCGFATISGSVLAGYAAIVGDVRLILTACIMSIPASLVLTKLRYPEEEESLTKGKVSVPPTKEKDVNFLHAAGNGAATGAQLVILISATLLALIALYTAANDLVGWCFDMLNIHRPIEDPTIKHPDWVSIAFILSYPFSIMAWFLGISWEQARTAGEIMAEKMVVNEFFAYEHLSKLNKTKVINARTFHVLAFALCGFANIGSIGIQVSALGAISPSRKQELAQLAVSAMLLGTMSTWLTAAVAGTLL
ncbi:Na+ dependent nucleoside transporter C-terminus-domain-containing protein [Powellomyces hirtus]|nr:Na+ dependent nucleoside transporter C-terminus-domain-containing protein [Powellomyces hirtus]